MTTSGERINYFAETDYRGRKIKFGIKEADRARHMYVIGKTGMGKSTLLENLAVQDIQNGEGVCFIDPHGSSAELLLSYVPEHRINDVVYFAPHDQEFPVAMNVMEDIGVDKRPLVASGLIGSFKKVWVDAWSPRMEYILNNALLALLEAPSSTLLGVNRMFADKAYREHVLTFVKDPSVLAFWKDEFAKYSDKFATEATAAIQNKVGQFAANPLIRNLVGQPQSTFDIRKLMDEKKIFIVNLSKGRIGESNAALIGSMLVTKIYLAAMSRAEVHAAQLNKLPPFYLYVDEFQSFANESFADILSEARKYKLSLTVAHQYIEQMSDEVRAAVFGNVGSMITFRVGSYDAEVLEKEFAPQFVAQDIVNLGFAQIYLKLMINNVGSQPFSATTLPRPELPNITFTQQVIQASRTQFGKPRATVEDEIRKWHEPVPGSNNDFIPKTKKVYPDTRVQQPQSSQSPAGQAQRKYPPREGDRPPRQPDNTDLRQQLMRATGQNFPEKKIDGPVPPERQNVESRPIDPSLAPAPTKGQPDTRQESSEKSVAQAIPAKPPESHQPFKILMQQVDIAKAEEVPQTVVKQAQPEKPQVQGAKSMLTPEMAVPQAPKAPPPVALQKPSEGLVGVTLAARPLQSTSEQKPVEQKGERREQSPISLKTLQRRDKGPSEQNLNVLKNALEQAMKKQEPPSVLQTKEKAPEQTIERRQETRVVERQPERPRVFQTDRQIPPRTVATETRRFDFKQPERNQPLATVVPDEKKENAPRQQSTQTLQQPDQPQFQTAKTYDKPPVLDERERRSFQTDNIPERRINEDRRSREVGVQPVVQEQKVANEPKSPQVREDVLQTREQSSKKEQEQQNQFDRRSSSFMPEIPEDVLRKVLGID